MPEVLLFSMRHMRLLGKKRWAVRNIVPENAVDIVIDVEFCIEFHIAFYIMICIAFYIAHRIFLMLVLLFLAHRNLIIWEISDASQMCCIFGCIGNIANSWNPMPILRQIKKRCIGIVVFHHFRCSAWPQKWYFHHRDLHGMAIPMHPFFQNQISCIGIQF